MEENKNEYELTMSKVLGYLFAGFAIVGIFALILAKWYTLRVCLSVDFILGLALMWWPEKWD